MKVSDIMTKKVITLREDQMIKDAIRVFAEKHIGGIPILDSQGKVVGIISEVDIIKKLKTRVSRFAMKFPSSHTIGLVFEESITNKELREAYRDISETVISKVMNRDIVVMDEGADMSELASELRKDHVKRIPIVNRKGELVGIVTRRDVLLALVDR